MLHVNFIPIIIDTRVRFGTNYNSKLPVHIQIIGTFLYGFRVL